MEPKKLRFIVVLAGVVLLLVLLTFGFGVTKKGPTTAPTPEDLSIPYFPEGENAAGDFSDLSDDVSAVEKEDKSPRAEQTLRVEQDTEPSPSGSGIEQIRQALKSLRKEPETLTKQERSPGEQVARLIALEMGKESPEDLAHEQLIDQILQKMNDFEPEVAMAAGVALREYATIADVPRLVAAIRDGGMSTSAQKFIFDRLGKLGDKGAFRLLDAELFRTIEELRYFIVDALGNLNDERAVPILLKLITEARSNPLGMRQRAVAALGRIDGERALYAARQGITYPSREIEAVRQLVLKRAERTEVPRTDTEMPIGRKRLHLHFEGLEYYLFNPPRRVNDLSSPRVLVCVHGRMYDAVELFEFCKDIASQDRIAVVAPLFNPIDFPEYGKFNLWGERTDRKLLRLLDHLAQHADVNSREVYFLGIEDGGLFVQAFTLTHASRVARAAVYVENPIEPEEKLMFPDGMLPTPLASDLYPSLHQFLKSDLSFLLPSTRREARVVVRALRQYEIRAELLGLTTRVTARQLMERGYAPTTVELVRKYLFGRP